MTQHTQLVLTGTVKRNCLASDEPLIVVNLCADWNNMAKYNVLRSLSEQYILPYQGDLTRYHHLIGEKPVAGGRPVE